MLCDNMISEADFCTLSMLAVFTWVSFVCHTTVYSKAPCWLVLWICLLVSFLNFSFLQSCNEFIHVAVLNSITFYLFWFNFFSFSVEYWPSSIKCFCAWFNPVGRSWLFLLWHVGYSLPSSEFSSGPHIFLWSANFCFVFHCGVLFSQGQCVSERHDPQIEIGIEDWDWCMACDKAPKLGLIDTLGTFISSFFYSASFVMFLDVMELICSVTMVKYFLLCLHCYPLQPTIFLKLQDCH